MSLPTPPRNARPCPTRDGGWSLTRAAALLAGALALAPVSAAQAQAPVPVPDGRAPQDIGVDASLLPGDDFFGYANGAWLKATRVPAGKGRWGAGSEIAELTRRQVEALLDDSAAAPPGSEAHKLADFRAAYLDEAAIEVRGIKPLKPLLDRIDGVRDQAGLTRLLGRELRADVDPLNLGVFESSHVLGLAMGAGIYGEKTHVAFLLQGGLGLPDRESYLGSEPRLEALRARYEEYIGRMLAQAGFDGAVPAAKRASAVMALETEIARSHATQEASANDRNADNLWTRADFVRLAPGMDWSAFFAAAGLARQPAFVAWQPGAVKGLAALVGSQPLQAWKDYLRFHALDRCADVLPRAFADLALGWRATEGAGTPLPNARAQRALEATKSALDGVLGKLYVERHFPAASKARVQAIVADVVAAFGRRVETVTWMSPGSRAVALDKLKSLYFGVGYPERWRDASGLAVSPRDAFGNLQRVADWRYRQTLARLGQPVDHGDWYIVPQWPGAVLTFHQNAYNFAAALLQPPKFDPEAPEAANYGAIGAIVGHEVSHFVDTLGADYEADGRMRRWWTAEDLAGYEAATAALVAQFSAYQPLPGTAIDGKLGLTETLADLGGLAAAFDAYRGALGSRAKDKDDLRQQDRQFFIGFARSWRTLYRDDALRAQAATDHPPERYRIATVRNIDAWYDAFDVQPGQRLYLEPKARIRVW